MNNIVKFLKNELMSDGVFGCLFILLGLILQFITFAVYNESLISLISGCAGIFAVVLCSQKKYYSYYFFAWIQLITYVVICFYKNLYGELLINAFYTVTMIYGMYSWKKNYNSESQCIISRKLSRNLSILLCIAFVFLSYTFYYLLEKTADMEPFWDSVTTVPAFIGQLLLMYRYREQWIYWIMVDIFSIVMWFSLGNFCMVSQYIFWTINCIYGWHKWSLNLNN